MTCKEILKSAGFPEEVIVLDFETFYDSDYNLKKMSTVEYVTDPRFGITGLGLYDYINTLPYCRFIPPERTTLQIETLQDIYGKNLENCTIVGQNLMFDCLILGWYFGIIPKYTVDILNLARHEDSQRHNNLAELCKIYKTSVQKGDTSQFKGLTYKQMSPGLQKRLQEYNKTDVLAEYELFETLLPKLSNPGVELRVADHTLKLFLNPRLNFDFELADNLIKEMQQELENTLGKVGLDTKTLRSNKFSTILQTALPEGEQLITKMGKKGAIPALAKTDEAFRALLNHPKEEVRNLAQARLAAKSWPTHIQKVEGMIRQAKARNGKIGVPLRYYAAHTARWGGTEGINLQNLPGIGRAGSGTNPLLSKIRHLLIAPPGYVLCTVDLAQVEARILAWFAGQEDLLNIFRENGDVYSYAATDLFGHPVRKAKKDDAPDVAREMTIKRGFGKDEILGAGFGMGATKFYIRCLANADLKPLFDSGTYDFAFIEKLIKTYRAKYSMIPKFWNNIEKAFRWVTKYPSEILAISKFTFWNEHGTVNVQLPSGRVLKYPHARINKIDNTIRWQYGHLWGGSITENLDQATARDILAEAILHIEDAGYKIAGHFHDEIVCVVPEEIAEKVLKDIQIIFCTNPVWAVGLPISSEGKVTKKFEK
jgi:DNA polymerase bacteriophage-type